MYICTLIRILRISLLDDGSSIHEVMITISNTSFHFIETSFSPLGSPGVSSNPMLDSIFDTKSNNRDNMSTKIMSLCFLIYAT